LVYLIVFQPIREVLCILHYHLSTGNHVGTAPFSIVLEIVKKAKGLPKEYNKGGYITNQLKPYAVQRDRQTETTRQDI